LSRYPFIEPDMETWAKKFRFYTEIKVRFSETDALGHLNNVNYFAYFEQGRLEYLEHLGLLNILLDRNSETMPVTANLECHYIAQVYFNEKLKVGVRVNQIGRSSMELHYIIYIPARDLIAAVGRGTIVNINKNTGKSTPIPDSIREKIGQFEMM
jgi:acyl-CoA thioester hydrolase